MEKEQSEGWKEQSQLSCPLRLERTALIIFLCWLSKTVRLFSEEQKHWVKKRPAVLEWCLVIVNTVATIFKLPHLWSRQCRMTLSKQGIYTEHVLPKAPFLKGMDYQIQRTQNSLQYPSPSITSQPCFKAALENKFYCLKLFFPISIEKYISCNSRRTFLYLNPNINDNTSHSPRISLKTRRTYLKLHLNLNRTSNCLECYS